MKNLIFLDIDGVLNSQLYFESDDFKKYDEIGYTHHKQISLSKIGLLNDLCIQTESGIVISSTWRNSYDIQALQELFDASSATFKIVGKTGHSESHIRGVEIHQWLKENTMKMFGVPSYSFYRYAIIDDDRDMLLEQANHFFQVDSYAGLTPNVCFRITQFFMQKHFRSF